MQHRSTARVPARPRQDRCRPRCRDVGSSRRLRDSFEDVLLPHFDSGFVVREVPIEGSPHLELRRLEPAGAAWVLVSEGGAPAHRPRGVASGRRGRRRLVGRPSGDEHRARVLGSARNLARLARAGAPSEDPAVVELRRGWLETWERFHAQPDNRPRTRVRAFELPLVFAWARDLDDPSLRITVTGHGAISDHAATIRAVLEEVVDRWSVDTIAIVESPRTYVQLMDRKERPSIYLEAADPEAQDFGALTGAQREQLVKLGWSDPKIEAMPYSEPSYAHEWSGSNFARECPRDADLGEVAAVVVSTLAVYGLDEADDLNVELFPAVT